MVIHEFLSIKEVTKNMTLDRIEWRKRIHMTTLTSSLRIRSQPQKLGIEAIHYLWTT